MIRIGVMGDVRRRAEDGEPLARKLGEAVGADVVSLDDALMGHTKHCIKIWTNLVQQGGDWLVVLEDDAVPVDGFREQLEMALAAAPNVGIVGLYLGTGYPKAWQRFIKKALATEPVDSNYLVSSHLLHTVGTAIRLELVNDLLRFIAWQSEDKRAWPFDEQITHWARSRGHKIAYTRPSLVDHADGPTLINHSDGEPRTAKRVAHEVGCRDRWRGSMTVDLP